MLEYYSEVYSVAGVSSDVSVAGGSLLFYNKLLLQDLQLLFFY